ncbi:unnamed protein product [Schistosoma mattheei]|uniref:Uncharacterized protein n=1 Tax=Schistosoma mattheei TaxID=31246 RepID=A0A3P8GAI5_9TREM|nr:unnamed protein product [Schistosoma mattheei]
MVLKLFRPMTYNEAKSSAQKIWCVLLHFFSYDSIPLPRLRPSPVWYRRLQSTLEKAGLATHTLVNALSRCSGSKYVWHIFGLALGCYGRFWFLGST